MHNLPRDFHRLERHLARQDNPYAHLIDRPRSAHGGAGASAPTVELTPLTFDARSSNELRPATFAQMVGQDRLKRLMARIVRNCKANGRPLDHIMLAGASGTGKTTLAQVTAHESGARVFQVDASQMSREVLEALRVTCRDGDVVIVDEIHLLVAGDRRGVGQAPKPEDFYHAMEDRKLPTQGGMLPFPRVTFIGCTTDEGLLPEAFLNRFPLRLTLDRYTPDDMARLATANATALRLGIAPAAANTFGLASRRNPRQLNTYVKNASALGANYIDQAVADEVVYDLNGCTPDGLTPDMQKMLLCLYRSRRESHGGQRIVYQASVNTVATVLGHSRDTKAVSLFVEPYLIEEGFVQVTHGGRQLTETGIARARELA